LGNRNYVSVKDDEEGKVSMRAEARGREKLEKDRKGEGDISMT